MRHSLIVHDDLSDLVRYLTPELKKKIRAVLDKICNEPLAGKALQEELQGLRSYKIGKIRVIYRLKSSSIVLVAVGPRETIYQKVTLEIKRQVSKV